MCLAAIPSHLQMVATHLAPAVTASASTVTPINLNFTVTLDLLKWVTLPAPLASGLAISIQYTGYHSLIWRLAQYSLHSAVIIVILESMHYFVLSIKALTRIEHLKAATHHSRFLQKQLFQFPGQFQSSLKRKHNCQYVLHSLMNWSLLETGKRFAKQTIVCVRI